MYCSLKKELHQQILNQYYNMSNQSLSNNNCRWDTLVKSTPQPPSQSLPTLDIRLGIPIFLFRGHLLEHCDTCEFYCDWTSAVQCWQAIQLLLRRDIHVCMTKRDRLYSAFSPSLITGSEIRYSLCSSELYMVQNGNVKLFQLLH